MEMATAARKGRVFIDGEKLRDIRERRFAWTRQELAARLQVAESTIAKIENGDTPSVYRKTLRKMAEAFGMSLEDAEAALSPEWDQNVDPYGQIKIPEPIPHFDLPIAAGDWVEVAIDNEMAGHRCTAAQIRQGLFRVHIRGDSMTPKFQDGDEVEFKLLCTPEGMPDFARMVVGHAYYVQKNDGFATFKYLRELQDEQLVLKASNKKYKQTLAARYDEVTRLGRYEHKLVK